MIHKTWRKIISPECLWSFMIFHVSPDYVKSSRSISLTSVAEFYDDSHLKIYLSGRCKDIRYTWRLRKSSFREVACLPRGQAADDARLKSTERAIHQTYLFRRFSPRMRFGFRARTWILRSATVGGDLIFCSANSRWRNRFRLRVRK